MLPIFILFLILSVLLTTLTTTPFFIAVLVACTVIFRKPWVFFAAFLGGLVLDLFFLRHLGQTPIILTLFIFVISLYERKFETQTLSFVFISSFLGSFIYLMIFGYNNVLVQSLVSALVAVLLFKIFNSKFEI